MSVELNLLNLQAQPEIPRKVSPEARRNVFERSELKSREDFPRLLRELREKASTKEKSPREQEESIQAGALIAFPFLPGEAVLNVEEGDTVGVGDLTVESSQPLLAVTPGASPQLDNAANLFTEGLEETSAVFLAGTGNGTLETATEAIVVTNVNGAIPTASFPGITAQAEEVFTTGETGTWPPEERTASSELPEEKSGLFTEWTAGSAIEGESTPTGALDLNVADEGVSEQPSLILKEMSEAIPQQETSTRPVKNSAVLDIDLAQSGLKEETAGSPPERESVDLLMAGDTPPATVKRRADEQDAVLHHVFDAVIRETGETAEPAGRLAALDEKVASTLPKEEVIGQILNGAKLMVKDQMSKIELRLHPAELGKLELSLVVERDLVTARFVAESQGVQSLIEANLSQLRSALQEAGLTVDLLQVDVQTGNEPQLQEHSFTADHRSKPSAPAQNGTDEWLAAEESYFVEDSWHGLVNLRV